MENKVVESVSLKEADNLKLIILEASDEDSKFHIKRVPISTIKRLSFKNISNFTSYNLQNNYYCVVLLTCLKPRYITLISWRVNFVCLQRSSRATGLCLGTREGSSSNRASSMGLSGGVAMVINYINRSQLLNITKLFRGHNSPNLIHTSQTSSSLQRHVYSTK